MTREGAMAVMAAWLTVALLVAATAAALLLPVWVGALLLAVAVAVLRRGWGRWALVGFTAMTVAVNALLFGLLVHAGPAWHAGPLRFDGLAAWRGAVGAVRLSAVLGANLAVLSWMPIARLLDGLGLPARATAFLGAVLLTAEDLGRDFVRLVDAQRLEGTWPHRLLGKATAAARLVPALTVLAVRHARVRADALRLAGHDTGPGFAPLVAMTALAVAARLALTAVLPNVSLAYAVVFVSGLAFGPRLGALTGLLGMAVSNLLITGVYPVPFANAPAMALLGLLGGILRRVDFSGRSRTDRLAGRLLAAACGVAGTLLFSIAVDLATWAAVPEFRATPGSLRVLVLQGLAFNVLPAVANAAVFAAVVGPVSAALRGSASGLHAKPSLSRFSPVDRALYP